MSFSDNKKNRWTHGDSLFMLGRLRPSSKNPPALAVGSVKTEILKIKGDWEEVANDCRSTVGKPPLGKEPSAEFKQMMLIAEHSPIRDIIVKWRWSGIPSWVATHWVRHKWECFITTQRTDRTGVDRSNLPQNAPVDFVGEANAQHLIDTMRKRLCFKAAKETRELALDLKLTLHDYEPELSDVLVPNCVYRGFCPEPHPCGFWDEFSRRFAYNKDQLLDCDERYAMYNAQK